MKTAVRTENLVKTFGGRTALDNLSFELPSKSFLSVFGPNGAGKTTLLRILATLSRPDSGNVSLYGKDIVEHAECARANIGYLSHAPMMYPDLTAEENLLLFARLYGVSDAQERVDELLYTVGLRHRRHDTLRGFSKGMLKRAAIARTLIHDPPIILLDEPYSALDPQATDIFDGLIDRYRAERTFIMTGHDVDKGLSLSTHVLLIEAGEKVFFEPCGSLDERALRNRYRAHGGMGVI